MNAPTPAPEVWCDDCAWSLRCNAAGLCVRRVEAAAGIVSPALLAEMQAALLGAPVGFLTGGPVLAAREDSAASTVEFAPITGRPQ